MTTGEPSEIAGQLDLSEGTAGTQKVGAFAVLSRDDRLTLKRELTLTPLPRPEAATPVVTWLDQERQSGGAHLAGFHCGRHPLLNPAFAATRLLQIEVLAHPTVRATLPDFFGITDPLTYTHDRLRGWQVTTSLEVPGQWARALHIGSFYTSPTEREMPDPEQEARASRAFTLAHELYRSLFGHSFATVDVFTTSDPWCQWFRGMFNATWVLYDRNQRHLWLLTTTDQD